MSYIFSLLFILSVKETNKVVLTYESAEKSSSVCLFHCAAQATLFTWFSSAGLLPQSSRGQTGEETGNKIATQGGFIWSLWITSCDLFDSLVLLLANTSQYGLLNERCLIVKRTPVVFIRSWKQWMDSWILCKITLSSVQISVVHIPSC